jgi:hypothetical protein
MMEEGEARQSDFVSTNEIDIFSSPEEENLFSSPEEENLLGHSHHSLSTDLNTYEAHQSISNVTSDETAIDIHEKSSNSSPKTFISASQSRTSWISYSTGKVVSKSGSSRNNKARIGSVDDISNIIQKTSTPPTHNSNNTSPMKKSVRKSNELTNDNNDIVKVSRPKRSSTRSQVDKTSKTQASSSSSSSVASSDALKLLEDLERASVSVLKNHGNATKTNISSTYDSKRKPSKHNRSDSLKETAQHRGRTSKEPKLTQGVKERRSSSRIQSEKSSERNSKHLSSNEALKRLEELEMLISSVTNE